jgi:hypothetical protein
MAIHIARGINNDVLIHDFQNKIVIPQNAASEFFNLKTVFYSYNIKRGVQVQLIPAKVAYNLKGQSKYLEVTKYHTTSDKINTAYIWVKYLELIPQRTGIY